MLTEEGLICTQGLEQEVQFDDITRGKCGHKYNYNHNYADKPLLCMLAQSPAAMRMEEDPATPENLREMRKIWPGALPKKTNVVYILRSFLNFNVAVYFAINSPHPTSTEWGPTPSLVSCTDISSQHSAHSYFPCLQSSSWSPFRPFALALP